MYWPKIFFHKSYARIRLPVKWFPRTTQLIFESQLKTYIVIFYDHPHRRDVSQKNWASTVIFSNKKPKTSLLPKLWHWVVSQFATTEERPQFFAAAAADGAASQQSAFSNNSAKSLCVRRLQNLEAATARFLRTLAMTGDFHINFRYPKAVVL